MFNSIIFCFLIFVDCVHASDIYVSECTRQAESLFRQNVHIDKMIFTHVPRGLIVSIDEKIFFDCGEEKLKLDGLPYLRQIADVFKQLDNNFVIEGHTKSINAPDGGYSSNWELSLARANNITKYLMRCAKVHPKKLFTVGFGEFMPFSKNVSQNDDLDNRIDFVILDYKASR